jgi:hypothetical protein
MSDRENHCPFLNRADHRCSDFFSIEQLQHAFEHCFHAYKACAVYQELLVERQARREYAAAAGVGHDVNSRPATNFTTNRFVQVRIPAAVTGAAHAAHAARTDGYAKPAL